MKNYDGFGIYVSSSGGGGVFLPLAGGTMTGLIYFVDGTSSIGAVGDTVTIADSKSIVLDVSGVTAEWNGGHWTMQGTTGLMILDSSIGEIYWKKTGGSPSTLSFVDSVTAYAYQLPSNSGTIALTSDIIPPSLSNVIGETTFATANETINCTANTFSVNLPTAVGIQGTTYVLVNSGTGVITLDGNGTETINGSLTIDLAQYVSRTVQSDGSNWIII